MAISAADLMDEAKCFCGVGGSNAERLIMALLQRIAESGGGGSGTGGAGSVGAGSPEGVVTATPGTSYYDSVGLAFWFKISGNGDTGWVQVV